MFVITGAQRRSRAAISPSPASCPPETRSPDRAGIRTSSSAFPTPAVWRRADRGDPRLGDPRERERRTRPAKARMGILGHANAHISGNANHSANDGTITRFGWKAQNKSLLIFAGEAYNVEMGISNQLFPQERDETPGCVYSATPDDTLNFTTSPASPSNPAVISDIEAFATFMRMLAPPTPAPDTQSIVRGRAGFRKRGMCPLPHSVVYHWQGDCQRLLEEAQRRAIQSACESFFRPAGPPHG